VRPVRLEILRRLKQHEGKKACNYFSILGLRDATPVSRRSAARERRQVLVYLDPDLAKELKIAAVRLETSALTQTEDSHGSEDVRVWGYGPDRQHPTSGSP